MERVVLVDENDKEIGTEEKIRAHKNGGKLHRAFSILIFNSKREMLIQKRADSKYHWPGVWANACCSHPRPGEKTEDAVHRRLMEEMGFDTKLKELFSFIYRATFDNGLTEWELDHVFVGEYDMEPKPNPKEVGDYDWVQIQELNKSIIDNPEKYSPWFKIILKKINFEELGAIFN